MSSNAAPTPEEAARGGIPERYARFLGIARSPDGNHAVVLLGTNEPPFLYPYQVVCGLGESGWVEEMSGNGPGWSTTADDPHDSGASNIGVATDWAEAPPGATAAVVSFAGQEHEVPVREGYFLFAAWNVAGDLAMGEYPSFVRWITS
jgi:hypothetical protein